MAGGIQSVVLLANGVGQVYTIFGERTWWAKAHFFVGAARRTAGRIPLRSGAEALVRPSVSMAVDVEKIRQMAERVAESEGLVLIDVELKGARANQVLRVFIDKREGVTHADCQLVSEQLSVMLDVEDLIPGHYVLEVSSPGLDRELRRENEYLHFAGRRARIALREPVGTQRVFEGRLAGVESGRVRLDLGDQGISEFELSNITKAKLIVEL
jgi:ribosome maturation factor RimP